MTSLKRFLTVAENAILVKALRPRFGNYQFKLEMAGESEDMHSFAKEIGEISQQHNIRVKNFHVYGAVEQEAWKRARKKDLRRAEKAVVTCKPWPAISLRLLSAPGDSTGELLGSWRRARERWIWTAGLTRVGLYVAQLEDQRALQADS
jgi:hypothetical protein